MRRAARARRARAGRGHYLAGARRPAVRPPAAWRCWSAGLQRRPRPPRCPLRRRFVRASTRTPTRALVGMLLDLFTISNVSIIEKNINGFHKS